jgi:hypothetical protein
MWPLLIYQQAAEFIEHKNLLILHSIIFFIVALAAGCAKHQASLYEWQPLTHPVKLQQFWASQGKNHLS